jgi:hypothetical protein
MLLLLLMMMMMMMMADIDNKSKRNSTYQTSVTCVLIDGCAQDNFIRASIIILLKKVKTPKSYSNTQTILKEREVFPTRKMGPNRQSSVYLLVKE